MIANNHQTGNNHLFLIDGYGYVFRAYHALPPLTRPDGTPVGAVLGFINMLLKLRSGMKQNGQHYMAMIFDAGEKTFRNDLYPEYKANRPPAPEDLKAQFPLIHEAAEALGLPAVSRPGYEADDLIATYVRIAREKGMDVTIVSSDKDLMQLVQDGVLMFDAMKNRPIGEKEVMEKFGVAPERVQDVLALIGDSSDNVPGIPGIGPKTAAELIQQYGSLEGLLTHAHEIKQPKRRENIEANTEQARLSYQLIGLCDTVDVDSDLSRFHLQTPDAKSLFAFLKTNHFHSVIPRVEKLFSLKNTEGKQAAATTVESDTLLSFPQIIETLDVLKKWVTRQATPTKLYIIPMPMGLAVSTGEAAILIPEPSAESSAQGTLDLGQTTPSLTMTEVITQLKPWLEDTAIPVIGHQLKSFYRHCIATGFLPTAPDDLQLISYVLDGNTHKHDLPALAALHLEQTLADAKALAGMENDAILKETALALRAVMQLHHQLRPRLFADHVLQVYETLERPLLPVLAEMEEAGVCVDPSVLARLSQKFAEEMQTLEKQIYEAAGREFNIGSPKQLGEVLFDELGLPGGKKSGKSGAYGTGADILETLDAEGHTLAGLVLRWRLLSKLRSTYTDALPKQISPVTKRIHTTFAQTVANTGRLSSVNPNLQNIPIRDEDGKKIREAFISEPGNFLLSADYSQIELRVLAHMANIETLQQAFQDGKDIHALTASQVFGVPLEKIDSTMRRRAKAINFGIIYGQTPFGLAQQLSIPRDEAKHYIDAYFKQYPGIRHFTEQVKEIAREQGYVTTLFGRKCYLDGIKDRNPARRNFAERAAINAPLQGTAADIIKRAMIQLMAVLKQDFSKARMILQVHDELIVECPEALAGKISVVMKKVMEDVMTLSVPLVVEVHQGTNWDTIR
ncbi:MAG: DNA polymerase I [Hyphomicrobiales bacterium]|nr:DNA polymerase I [Rickettsiales bacterium]MCP5361192.1 DNA polymerase I [Hyphomicrobiales bacterium]